MSQQNYNLILSVWWKLQVLSFYSNLALIYRDYKGEFRLPDFKNSYGRVFPQMTFLIDVVATIL